MDSSCFKRFYTGIGLNFNGLGSSPPMRSSRWASTASEPSKKTTLESPSYAKMCVAILFKNQRSCEMQMVVPFQD